MFLIAGVQIAITLPPKFDSYVGPLLKDLLNDTIKSMEASNASSDFINTVRTAYSGIDELFSLFFMGVPGKCIVI